MTRKKNSAETNDIEKLDKLIGIIYRDLTEEGGRFKIMELLKAMEFKRKIAPPDDREGAFWDMIDELRASDMGANGDIDAVGHSSASTSDKCKTPKANKGTRKSQ